MNQIETLIRILYYYNAEFVILTPLDEFLQVSFLLYMLKCNYTDYVESNYTDYVKSNYTDNAKCNYTDNVECSYTDYTECNYTCLLYTSPSPRD